MHKICVCVLLWLAGVAFLGTNVRSEDSRGALGQTAPQPAAVAARQKTSEQLNGTAPADGQGLKQRTDNSSVNATQSDRAASGTPELQQQQQQQELQTQQQQCKQTHISQIKCWLDADGYIAGLAFETETGIIAPALCQADGLVTDGGMLETGEAIVEVVTCRGPTGGIWWLEFHTNKRRKSPLTCGAGGLMQQHKQGPEAAGAGQCIGLTQLQHTSVSTAHVDATKRKPSKPVPLPADAFPVAGLVGRCNRHRQVSSFRNTCWQRDNKQKQPVPSRPVESPAVLDPIS